MPCIQIVSLILSISGIVLLLCRMRGNYRIRLYHAGTLLWLIHAAAFYAAVILYNVEQSPFFNSWSLLLRLHILLTTILQVAHGTARDHNNNRIKQWVKFFNE